jgi:plastocyanin domain-containing protein
MADFNFLDLKIVTDTTNKKVTVNFNTLRGTFTLSSSSTTTIGTANGIYLKIAYSGSGTSTSITVDLKTLSLPTGAYSFIDCEITGTPKNPTPRHISKEPISL